MRNWYKSSTSRMALAAGLAVVALATSQSALAGPTGGQVAAGQASIAGQGSNAVLVTQSTDRAIITWQSFNTTTGQSIQFVQPNSGSIALNRVVGGGPSSLNGSLTANGQVFIINPYGVLFSKSSQVNVAGLLVSSADVNAASFMSGAKTLRFDAAGSPSAVIENDGNITIADSGLAAFVAPQVINSGVITARYGQIALGAGKAFTLDLNGDGLISFAPGDGASAATGSGAAIQAGGQILASAGTVTLSAATARQVVNQSVEVTGLISAASSRVAANGKVHLGGGAVILSGAGDVTLSQSAQLDASSAAGQGGQISVTGAHVEVAGAQILASGATGGGQVLIGGGAQGQGSLAHAATTVLDAGTLINADATGQGDGGHIVLWSDTATSFDGLLSARGGAQGGKGGLVETSSAGNLQVLGMVKADARAAGGAAGMWLLDPTDITVSATLGDATMNETGATWVGTGAAGTVKAATLSTALTNGVSVTLSTTSTYGGTGNITFTGGPTITAGGNGAVTLTLTAAAGINFGTGTSFVETGTGKLSVAATAAAGAISGTTTGFTTNGGAVTLTATAAPSFTAATSQVTTNGVSYGGAIGFNGVSLNVGAGTATLTGGFATETALANVYNAGVLLRGTVALTTTNATANAIAISGTGSYGLLLGAPTINLTSTGNVTLSGTATGKVAGLAGLAVGADTSGTLFALTDQAGNLTLKGQTPDGAAETGVLLGYGGATNIINSGVGTVQITGVTGATAAATNTSPSIATAGANVTFTTGAGALSFNGTSYAAGAPYSASMSTITPTGIYITGGAIKDTNGGAISLTSTRGATTANAPLVLGASLTVTGAPVAAKLTADDGLYFGVPTLVSTFGNTNNNAVQYLLTTSANSLTATGAGVLSLTGVSNNGAIVGGATTLTTNGGNLSLTATNPPAPSNAANGYFQSSSYNGERDYNQSGGALYLYYAGAIYFNGLTLNVGSGQATLTGSAGANEPQLNAASTAFSPIFDNGVSLTGAINLTAATGGTIAVNGTGGFGIGLGAPYVALATNGKVTLTGTASGKTPARGGISIGADLSNQPGQAAGQYAVQDLSGDLTLNGYFSGTVIGAGTLLSNGSTYTTIAQYGVADQTFYSPNIWNQGSGKLTLYGGPTPGASYANNPFSANYLLDGPVFNNAGTGSFLLQGDGGINFFQGSLLNSPTGTFNVVGNGAGGQTGASLSLNAITNGSPTVASTGTMTITGSSGSGGGLYLSTYSLGPNITNYGSNLTLNGSSTTGNGVQIANNGLGLNFSQNGPQSSQFTISGTAVNNGTGLVVSGSTTNNLTFNRNSNGGAFTITGVATGSSTGLSINNTAVTFSDAFSQTNSGAAGFKVVGTSAMGNGLYINQSASVSQLAGALELDGNAGTAAGASGVLIAAPNPAGGTSPVSLNDSSGIYAMVIQGQSTSGPGVNIYGSGTNYAGALSTQGPINLSGISTQGGTGLSVNLTTLTAAGYSGTDTLKFTGTSASGPGIALTLTTLSPKLTTTFSGTSTSGAGLTLAGGAATTPLSVGATGLNQSSVSLTGTSTSGAGLSFSAVGLNDSAPLTLTGSSSTGVGLSFTGGTTATSFTTASNNNILGSLTLSGTSSSNTGLALSAYGAWKNSLVVVANGVSTGAVGLNLGLNGATSVTTPSINNGATTTPQATPGLSLTGTSGTGTGLLVSAPSFNLLNGTFALTGTSNGGSAAASGSGVIFSAASASLGLSNATLNLTGSRNFYSTSTSDILLNNFSAVGDVTSNLNLFGNGISFASFNLTGFNTLNVAPTDPTHDFSMTGQSSTAAIMLVAVLNPTAKDATAAVATFGLTSETGNTTLAAISDTETGALTVLGGTGALQLGAITANATQSVFISDVKAGASSGLSLSGPLSATKAAVVLASNGAVTDTSAVSAASLAVQAGGAVSLANSGNTFPLLAVSTTSGAVTIFDGSSVTLTTLTGGNRTLSGLVDASPLATDRVQLVSTGAINISQAVSVASAGSGTTNPALILAAGSTQSVATQSATGTVASGYDIAFTGAMAKTPSAAITIGGQGTAILYTGTLAGSVGLTDATDGGVGTVGGYRYDSSQTATNYSLALGPGIDVVYREQPILTSTWQVPGAVFSTSGSGASATLTYTGAPVTPALAIASALPNGDSITLSGTLNVRVSAQATGQNPLNNGAAQDVGSYNFGAASISNGLGYAVIAPGPLSLTINPYTLNVTYGSGLSVLPKTYDGTRTANLTVTGAPTVALLGNDGQSVAVGYTNGIGPAGVYAQADAGSNIAVSLNNLTLVSLSKSNANANIISDYSVVGPANLSGTITPASLSISGVSALSRAYNGGYGAQLQVSNNATVNGWVSTADSSSVRVNLAALTGTFNTNQVGNNLAVNISAPTQGAGATLFTGQSSAIAHILQDYTLVLPTVTANITPVTLTYNANSLSVPTLIYNGSTNATINVANPANPNLFSGYVGSDSATTTPAVTTKVTGTYDAPDVGTRTVTVTPGSITLTGANANDYLIPNISLSALIKPATLVVSGLTAANKQYDGTDAVTINTSGLNLNIPVAADIGKLALTGTPTGVAAQKDVGSNITVTVQNLSLAQTGPWQDYTLVIPQLTTAITPAPVTLGGLSVQTRDYDGTTSASLLGAAQLVGLFGGDQVQLSSAGVMANFLTSGVGVNKPVTLGSTSYGLTGAQASDYTLTLPSLSGTITPKAVTVSGLSATDRTYDGTTVDAVTGVPSLVGVVKGDNLAVNTVGVSGALSDPNVGVQSVTVQGLTLSGASALNYTLKTDVLSAAITPAPLTVSGLTAQSKTYDGTTLATLKGTAQVSGIITGDQNGLQLLGTPTGAFSTANTGVGLAVLLNGVSLGGVKAYDYQLLPTLLSASISPATLTYLASPSSRLLGTPNPTLTGTVTGFIAGQTLADATTGVLSFASPAGPFAPYGTYPIEGGDSPPLFKGDSSRL